jgi:hypothetical protein
MYLIIIGNYILIPIHFHRTIYFIYWLLIGNENGKLVSIVVFLQQTIGFPMDTNCGPQLANLFLHTGKADFRQGLLMKISPN